MKVNDLIGLNVVPASYLYGWLGLGRHWYNSLSEEQAVPFLEVQYSI